MGSTTETKSDAFEVLDWQSVDEIASSWTEYLCLEKRDDGTGVLTVRGYTYIGEVSEFMDEDGDLPEEIYGCPVMGTEDGYIVGGSLVLQDDDSEFCFKRHEIEQALDWLQNHGWQPEKYSDSIHALFS